MILLAGMIVPLTAQTTQPSQQDALRSEIIKMSKADHLSPLFSKIYQAVSPSVVVVRTAQRVGINYLPYYDDEDIRQQYGYRTGQGSGVIVDAKNGYVVTNNHVVAGAQKVEIILNDGRVLKAHWVRSDPLSDIAVVKIPAENLTATPFGDSDRLDVGSWVLAFGAPMGLPQTVTAGIVSAKGRKTSGLDYQDFIQTDAAINLGNSGGPLVNMRGEVVGINTLILSSTGMYAGIGLAVPSNMVRDVMKQLVDKGKVERGYLGVYIQDVGPRLARSMNLPSGSGALISNVLPGSPAQKAGLLERDFVMSVNGRDVRNANDLRNSVAAVSPGQTAELKLVRDGRVLTLKITIGTPPARMTSYVNTVTEAKKEDFDRQVGLLGLTMSPKLAKQFGYDRNVTGVLILDVVRGSEAFEASILPGMVVSHVNDKPITTAAELKKAIEDHRGKGLRLTVINPMGGKWYILLPLENYKE